MSKQNYFVDGNFIDRLAVLLERPLVQAECTVAPTSVPNTATVSNRDAVLDITIPLAGGGTETKGVRYYQLDLASMAAIGLPKRSVNEDTTIHALLPTIKRITGIPFTADDLVDAPVVFTGPGSDFTIPLVAKVGSKWFKGRYDLPVSRKPLLSSVAAFGTYMGSI